MIQAIIEANPTRKNFIANWVLRHKPKVVGIYRLILKNGSNNFGASTMQGVMKRLKAKGIEVVVFEPTSKADEFYNSLVIRDFEAFKLNPMQYSNRMANELTDVPEKVYTRDLCGDDQHASDIC